MNSPQIHGESIAAILHLAATARRRDISQAIVSATGGRVAAGPFEGMMLPEQTSWLDGDVAPKLLGIYESELHELMLKIRASDYATIINIGCAEGYYAVGLARLIPRATIYAFDANEQAQSVCRTAASVNGVADRIVVRGLCDSATLASVLTAAGRAFLLLDCEGGELQLLDPATTPGLRSEDFAVECHDFYNRSISATIVSRFTPTHNVGVIKEGARNPNASPLLTSLSSLDRWLAVCEFRPETMHWIVATAK